MESSTVPFLTFRFFQLSLSPPQLPLKDNTLGPYATRCHQQTSVARANCQDQTSLHVIQCHLRRERKVFFSMSPFPVNGECASA